MFKTYLELGFTHILDINAYDHILFVIVLCAVYSFKDWRKIFILVTAFTIGHSITLALSAMKIVVFPSDIIEFLIPLTIFATAIFNVTNNQTHHKYININYALAMFFGWIHGLGFSNFFKALLGAEEEIIGPLFAFNIGVELGQIIIVAITVLAGYVIVNRFNSPQRDWNLFISGAAAGIAIILMMEAKFW